MEPDKIIEAFTEVVREQDYVFSDDAIADLPTLQKNLAAIEHLTSEAIAEVIRQWYKNHKSVIDALLVQEREISKVAKTKPQSQENTLENRFRVLQEEVEKLQERKKGDNPIISLLVQNREIRKVTKTKAQSQENTLENSYRVLPEEVEKLQEKKKGD